jgi:hypothetical protein
MTCLDKMFVRRNQTARDEDRHDSALFLGEQAAFSRTFRKSLSTAFSVSPARASGDASKRPRRVTYWRGRSHFRRAPERSPP